MDRKEAWEMFKKTGKIEYYLLFKNKKRSDFLARRSRRYNLKRNSL